MKKVALSCDLFFLRYLADSNRRIRFCRPVPSPSAKVPSHKAMQKYDFSTYLQNKKGHR